MLILLIAIYLERDFYDISMSAVKNLGLFSVGSELLRRSSRFHVRADFVSVSRMGTKQ